MNKADLQKRIDEIKWFHRIELPYDEGGVLETPGILNEDHCSEYAATVRFGVPKDLTGKTVLDVGAHQGYFSFLAQKRGGKVTAVEPNQGDGDNIRGFELANQVLEYGVRLNKCDLKTYSYLERKHDIVLVYGVLYHVSSPLDELQRVCDMTNEFALIETAVGPGIENEGRSLPIWHFRPGYDADPTNIWYPSIEGLCQALIHVGFKNVEMVYMTEGFERVTVKALK